ncbi:MAG: hypothetical protein EA425_12330 [Puniceicoccaceae bacterium]|nr:MAG: hypothetical protein EA425_12330 [Puniceicoccaceae bacterium]
MSPSAPTLTESFCRDLAPDNLTSRRTQRYRGGGFHLSLATDCTVDERELLTRLYSATGEVMRLTDPALADNPLREGQMVDMARRSELHLLEEQLLASIREIASSRSDSVRKAFLRLATGPFASMCEYFLLIQAGGVEKEYIQTLHYLARDHRKIMRAFFEDLDPPTRKHDTAIRQHSLDLLLEKWRTGLFRSKDHPLIIRFQTFYHGTVAERCLEFAELDQIFYQLAHNCLRFSSTQVLDITVLLTGDGRNLRWIFSNAIAPDHAAKLQAILDDGLNPFEHGVATGDGEGHGLGFVGEVVVHAFGLSDLYEALKKGHLGISVAKDRFLLWFHWPAVA